MFPSYLVYWRSWKHTEADQPDIQFTTCGFLEHRGVWRRVKHQVNFCMLLTLVQAFPKRTGDWGLSPKSFSSPSSCWGRRSPPQTPHCATLRSIRSTWLFPGCWVWGLLLENFPQPAQPEYSPLSVSHFVRCLKKIKQQKQTNKKTVLAVEMSTRVCCDNYRLSFARWKFSPN